MSYQSIVALTIFGTAAAIGIYLALLRAARRSQIAPRHLPAILLIVGLLCRIAFAWLTPAFHAPDEQAHFHYVEYLATHGELPVQVSRTGAPTCDWEYYQPPLYYIALTPLFHLSQKLSLDEAVTVRILRLPSILFWAATVFFTLLFLARLGVTDGFVRTLTVGLVALLPTYTFLSSMINNDNLLIAFGSAILWLAAMPRRGVGQSILLGFVLSVALLTKLSAVVYLPLIALIAFAAVRDGQSRGRAILAAVLPLVIACVVLSPWVMRNIELYGSLTGESAANNVHHWKSIFHGLFKVGSSIQDTYWAVSGIYNNVGYPYFTLGRHISYIAMAGLLFGLFRKRRELVALVPGRAAMMIVFIIAILINLALVFRFGLLYAQGQGRFLYPLLLPISLLLGMGGRMLPVTEHREAEFHSAGFLIIYCVSFVFSSLAVFTRALS